MKKFLHILLFLMFFVSSLFSQFRSTKKGIAYGNLSEADIAAISGGVSWFYNWYVEPNGSAINIYQDYNMDFVPMVWGKTSDTALLRTFLTAHPNVKYILGFNEPNFTSQSDMTPAEAAARWPMLEKIADDFGLKIVGPAVNYCGSCVDIPGTTNDSDPVVYLDSFFHDCPGCRVDYIAMHSYMCYSGALSGYLDRLKKYGKPIWLTEFACWDQPTITLNMQKGLVLGAIDLMESDTMIFRYSWITGDRTSNYPYLDLFEAQPGKLTELGDLYVNYNPVHDTSIYTKIPARIEAENYTTMSGIALEAVDDFDGLADVGWIDAGDWLEYNIEVPDTESYYLYVRISSNANTSLEFRENDSILGTMQVPNSGGWQNWKTLVKQVTLNKGKHKLQLYTPTGQFNLNWIKFSNRTNIAPKAIVGADQTITLPIDSVVLEGSGTDSDGDTLLYKWSEASGPANCVFSDVSDSITKVKSLKAGTYIFTFIVFDGFETASGTVKVKVVKAVSSVNNSTVTANIYPNPVTDRLYIKSEAFLLKSEVSVIDQTGRIIWDHKFGPSLDQAEIDFSNFKRGFYIIQIRNIDTVTNIPVVK